MHVHGLVGKKCTSNHSTILRCILVFHCWNASDAPGIVVLSLSAFPLEMPHLPAFVASVTHLGNSGSGGLFSWPPTGPSGMPVSVEILTVQLSTGSLVMEVTLGAFK